MQAIERRLGRVLADGDVGIVATISQHPVAPRHRLKLELTTGGRSKTHTLVAERCASLVDATAILVAVAYMAAPELPAAGLDGLEAPEPASTEPVAEVDPTAARTDLDEPAAPAVVREPVVPAAPPASKSGGPGVFVRIQGGVELNGVAGATGAAGAAGVAVGPLWRRARLEFQGLYVDPGRDFTAERTTLDVSLFTGAVVGCGRLGRGRWELPLCGGMQLGGVRATATGPGAPSGTRIHAWLAGTVTAAVAWHAGRRLSLMLALHGLFHMHVPRFEIHRQGESRDLFNPGPVSGRLLFGLELRFADPW